MEGEQTMLKILQFTAPWCPTCPQMDIVLAGLRGLEKIELGTEAGDRLANEHRIGSLPTVIVMRDEEPVWRKSGLFPRGEIDEMLEG